MDFQECSSSKSIDRSPDFMLPDRMAALELEDVQVQENNIDNKPLRRSLRRRSGVFENIFTGPVEEENTTKRRVITKPRKRQPSKDENKRIKDYYLCKKVKRLPNTLETIFEEPEVKKNEVVFIASRKQRRTLSLGNPPTKDKIRKRVLKAKKLVLNRSYLNRKEITMETLVKKLSNIVE